MTHPRLSVSEMCTYPRPFGDELELWDELGVKQVGVITAKLDAYGRDKAVAALRERSMKANTVITGCFDLSAPVGNAGPGAWTTEYDGPLAARRPSILVPGSPVPGGAGGRLCVRGREP